MAGEGFIAHMIASLKANKRSRISTFDKIKNFKTSGKSQLLFPNKASKKDIKKIRVKIQKQNNISFLKNVVLILIALVILLYIISLDKY